jgi:hypothetical protein
MMVKLLGWISPTMVAHATCMNAVAATFVGYIVRFKVVVLEVCYEDTDKGVEPDQRLEQVVKAVIVDGAEMCTVGFLPRHVAARQVQAAVLNNKFAQNIEFYNNAHASNARHNKSLRNHGVASFILLDNVPIME